MNLTDDAKALFVGIFQSARVVMTIDETQTELTPRGAAAMRELIGAGLVKTMRHSNGMTQYSQTAAGRAVDRSAMAGDDQHAFLERAARWQVMQARVGGVAA